MARRPLRQYRRRGGRRSRKYIRGNINETLDLATLGGLALTSTGFDDVVNEKTLISSIVVTANMIGITSSNDNDGPIMVGVAHGDYSMAEIEAVIENQGSWNEGDLVNQETQKRWVRKLGVFKFPLGTDGVESLWDGAERKFKLNWILMQGQILSLWVYNLGTSAIDTGAKVYLEGHANLWPR